MVSEDERERNLRTDKRETREGQGGIREYLGCLGDRTPRDPALFVPGILILWSDGWFGVEGGHGGASQSLPSPSLPPPLLPLSLGPRCLV